ncbi:MAG: phosphatase PAP2 family protein [Anaerolineaceae bacterium]|jgi:undecaprenyl-diphosphatase
MNDLLNKDAELSQKFLVTEDKKILRGVLDAISHSCDSWYWLVALVIIWAVTEGTTRQMAIFMAFGLFLLAVLVLAAKFLIKRPRPEGEFGQIYRITDPHSFPSGHAARAMAIAVMVSTLGNIWVTLLVFVWAILVGYSRLALALHYVSDVLAGWLIGLIGGLVAIQLFPLFVRLVGQYFPTLL